MTNTRHHLMKKQIYQSPISEVAGLLPREHLLQMSILLLTEPINSPYVLEDTTTGFLDY